MGIKRKVEEKKMSMSKNIARLAVTAGLTAALSFGGVMAPVTMAFAEGVPTVATEKGKVNITDNEYADTSFKGIQIFTAKVTQDQSDGNWDESGDKTLSDIQWVPGKVQTLVTTALADVEGAPKPDAGAQEWAEFISKAQSSNFGKNTAVNTGSALDLIAKALEGDNTIAWTQPSDSTKGSFNNLDHGYWLFVTDAPGSTDAYTSPIFTIVGGSDVNVNPKKSVPKVTKAVKDDKNGKFVTDNSKDVFSAPNKSADSASEQPIDYQLAGTVASNINTYTKYSYAFTDELPSTMVPVCDENGKPVVKVKIGDTVVEDNCYTVTYPSEESNNKLTVSFDNLKEVKNEAGESIVVDGNSKVYVNYQAKLVARKINENILGKAQTNTVKLTYSNNPHDIDSTGTTVTHPAYDYTYGIDVTKVGSDKDETGKHKTLEGVQFTLQEKGSSEFIKADGTTTSTKDDAILTTDRNGKINVVGLDEGTYTLTEVTPAPGYNNSAASGVTFTIASDSLPTNGDPFTPSCTLAEGTEGNLAQASNATDGKVHLTVTDQKGSNLPLTGLNGVTFTWIAGGAVLCIGVAHLIRSRRQAEESEQE